MEWAMQMEWAPPQGMPREEAVAQAKDLLTNFLWDNIPLNDWRGALMSLLGDTGPEIEEAASALLLSFPGQMPSNYF